jgi:hypothetical protein
MESVLALEVGAAASKIFSRAIMYWGSDGSIALYSTSAGVGVTGPSVINGKILLFSKIHQARPDQAWFQFGIGKR